MNATTSLQITAAHSPSWRPVLLRCAWKEVRMLRGFWLGVGMIALFLMFAVSGLASGETKLEWLAMTSWGAAALNAVGAAVTLFAVEREERTDAFLRLLPRHEGPMLAGKLLAAVVTSFALAVALLLAAGIIAGFQWPAAQLAGSIAAMGSATVFEWLAWGVFMSLVCPQPLLAAVLAIAAASLGSQLAIFASSESANGFSFADFRNAIPHRMVLAIAVVALDVYLGLRWLRPRPARRKHASLTPLAEPAVERGAIAPLAVPAAALLPASRRRLFARLLWQTWHEGRWAMLAILPVGLFLLVSDALLSGLAMSRWGGIGPPIFSLLAIPALYGAMTFRADQRGRQYRFLADHAAPPVVVWAARQVVWLAPVFVIGVILSLAAWVGVLAALRSWVTDTFGRSGNPLRSLFSGDPNAPYALAIEIEQGRRFLASATVTAWFGALAAYGFGQLCSMFIRSNILAGFAALLISAALSLWCLAITASGLPALYFAMPLALAALVASLLRCRNWLTERRGLKHWLAPAAVMAVPLAVLATSIGAVRIAQVSQPSVYYQFIREPLPVTLERWESEDEAARAVALRYERLGAELRQEIVDHAAPDTSADSVNDRRSVAGRDTVVGAMEPAALRELLKASQSQLDQLAEISQASRCRFTEMRPGTPQFNNLSFLMGMLDDDAVRLIAAGDLDRALTRMITVRRMQAHRMQYQPGFVYFFNYGTRDIESLLVRWATAPKQTSQRIIHAIGQLSACDKLVPSANEGIVADYLEIREIVRGETPPTFFQNLRRGDAAPPWNERLAVYLNEIPWERKRAELALERMTELRLNYIDAVTHCLEPTNGNRRSDNVANDLDVLLNDNVDWDSGVARIPRPAALARFGNWVQVELQQQLLAASENSYLPAIEMAHRGQLSVEMRRFLRERAVRAGEMICLSLIAYHLDHGAYPDSLNKLVPKYSPHGLVADPFTCGPFEYRPKGFVYPLRTDESERTSDFVPAETPLLWAAVAPRVVPHDGWVAELRDSYGSARLLRVEDPAGHDPDPALDGATPVHVIQFERDGWFTRDPVILPLPKFPKIVPQP